jgi:hypothetical protein
MEKMTRFDRLAQFNRDRDFIVCRAIKAQGRVFGPKEPFDKTLVTTRRLRQLYEQRFLMFAPTGKVERVRMRRKA